MTQLSEKVLSKIEQEKIIPIPKWKLLLKDWFVWGMAITGVLLGALSVAISIHLALTPMANLPAQSLRYQVLEKLSVIPYFWLALLLVFLYIAYHNFLHTDKGYRWKTFQIVGGMMALSILIGVLLVGTGSARRLNAFFVNSIPGYTQFADRRGLHWSAPENGRLAGRILTINMRTNRLTLRELQGGVWTVHYSSSTTGDSSPTTGEYVRVLGNVSGINDFQADQISSWEASKPDMQGMRRRLRINR